MYSSYYTIGYCYHNSLKRVNCMHIIMWLICYWPYTVYDDYSYIIIFVFPLIFVITSSLIT